MIRALHGRAAVLGLVALLAAPATALADLYRWRDPQTGSTRFSNLPPPWHGENARGRGPAVDVIPSPKPPKPRVAALEPQNADGREAPSDAAATANAGSGRAAGATRPLPEFDARHQRLLERLASVTNLPNAQAATTEMQAAMNAYRELIAAMDRADPEGAEARRSRDEPLLKRIGEAFARRYGAGAAPRSP